MKLIKSLFIIMFIVIAPIALAKAKPFMKPLPAISCGIPNTTAFWKLDSPRAWGVKYPDATGRGNDLTIGQDQSPQNSSVDLRLASSIGATFASPNQALNGALSNWYVWKRAITKAERDALLSGERYPFNTTTSLQDYSCVWLLDEAANSATYASHGTGCPSLSRTGTVGTVTAPDGVSNAASFAGASYLSATVSSTFQSGGNYTVMGYVNPTAINSNNQEILWGQISLANGSSSYDIGAVIYLQGQTSSGATWNVDHGGAADFGRSSNGVIANHAAGTPLLGQWSKVLFTYYANQGLDCLWATGASGTNVPSCLSRNLLNPQNGSTGLFSLGTTYPSTNANNGWDFQAPPTYLTTLTPSDDVKFGQRDHMFWIGKIKFSSTTSDQYFAGMRNNTTGNPWLLQQFTDGKMYAIIGNDSALQKFVATTFSDTTSYHSVVMAVRASDHTIHLCIDTCTIDGAGDTFATLTTPQWNAVTSGTLPFTIGGANNGTNAYNKLFKGTIQFVGHANHFPTTAEITKIANGCKNP